MRVNQRAFVNICAYVDIHRRHADHTRRNMRALSDRRSAGHHPYLLAGGEAAGGKGIFVDKGERVSACFFQYAETKAEQDALLYPGVHAPRAVLFFSGTELA